jgi:cytochrome c556
MNRRRIVLLILLGAVVLVPLVWAAAPAQGPRPNQVSDFMKLKLTHSQKVLEGIAVEDFEMIAKHAQQMGLLAQDANWMVYQTPQYRHHSADFQATAEQLSEAAKKKNLDGAALAYVQLTMSCVNCHKYTRGLKMARLN